MSIDGPSASNSSEKLPTPPSNSSPEMLLHTPPVTSNISGGDTTPVNSAISSTNPEGKVNHTPVTSNSSGDDSTPKNNPISTTDPEGKVNGNGNTADKRRTTKKYDEWGPGTIQSDDEVDNLSGDDSGGSGTDDEMEHHGHHFKKRAADSNFFADFKFLESEKDYHQDPWDEVLKYVRRNERGDIVTNKIAKIRQEEINKRKEKKAMLQKNGVDVKDEALDSDMGEVSEDEFLPDSATRDELRQKTDEVRRKEKQKGKPEKDRRTKEEIEREEEEKKFFEDAPQPNTEATFLEMNFSRPLLKAIDSMGYDTPTPIQAAAIPMGLIGRDICACAATGTGKTAAYMLPILERLLFKPIQDVVIRVLVLVPTRELGVQVFQVANELAKFTGIFIAMTVGGLDLKTQKDLLQKIPDIVIATPGRLLDHLENTPAFGLERVEVLVLDEADQLLDEHFEEQMKDIMKQCSPTHQTMLFSATMTSKVKELALVALKNPVKVFVNQNTDVANNLRQEIIKIKSAKQEHLREAIVLYLVSRSCKENTIVFVDTRDRAHRLNIVLGLLGIKCSELHGKLKQTNRLQSLHKFKTREIDVLVATDVAARGLDIAGVKTIISYALPPSYKRYVHRVGRTARAGHCGRAISICTDAEHYKLKEIRKNSRVALFERVLNKDVLNKYYGKIIKLEPAIQRVLEEEAAEKELINAQKAIDSLENQLKENAERKRASSSSDKASENKKKKQAPEENGPDKKKTTRKARRKAKRKATQDDQELTTKMRWEVYRTKKESRIGRLKVSNVQDEENEQQEGALPEAQPKKRGPKSSFDNEIRGQKRPFSKERKDPKSSFNKSMKGPKNSFDKELTSTDRKSLKKFRAGPSYSEQKAAFQSKHPGKKFKAKKGRK